MLVSLPDELRRLIAKCLLSTVNKSTSFSVRNLDSMLEVRAAILSLRRYLGDIAWDLEFSSYYRVIEILGHDDLQLGSPSRMSWAFG